MLVGSPCDGMLFVDYMSHPPLTTDLSRVVFVMTAHRALF